MTLTMAIVKMRSMREGAEDDEPGGDGSGGDGSGGGGGGCEE